MGKSKEASMRLMLQDQLETAMQMLDEGKIEDVKDFLRWDEGSKNHLRSAMSLSERIRTWVEIDCDGQFAITDVYRQFNQRDEKDKNNAQQILKRLKDDGHIAKFGGRHGNYRKIDRDLEELDWKGADPTPIEFNWPLDIGSYFVCYPKNTMVIAGAKDAGKSCFFFDFIKRNMAGFDIHYYTSEMSKEELNVRLTMHTDVKLDDWQFHAYERGENFGDAIACNPNSVHIVDWLEINDEFSSQAGNQIKEMHEAVEQGVVLIGLGKSFGAELGRGAAFSLQRPRLYITMERGLARCISAKNRVRGLESSPVGNIMWYKIIGGWNLKEQGIWHDEYPGELESMGWIKKTKSGERRTFYDGTDQD